MAVSIAIDLGGSHVAVGLVRGRELVGVSILPTEPGVLLAPLLPIIAGYVEDLIALHAIDRRTMLGVAVSIAAMVDWRENRVLGTNGKYPDASQLDLALWSEETLGLRLCIENDARMALLGEWYAGAAQGVDSVIMVTLGTGIGCAVIAGGKPFRSSQPQGGCLGGHIPVDLHGRLCSCGAIGCMEAEASTWALPLILRDWPEIETSVLYPDLKGGFKALFAAASGGDRVAEAVRRHCVRVWAVGVVGLVHAYGPEVVLLGGGVLQGEQFLLPDIRTYVDKHAWTPKAKVVLRPGSLGTHAALFGAIPLLENQ